MFETGLWSCFWLCYLDNKVYFLASNPQDFTIDFKESDTAIHALDEGESF